MAESKLSFNERACPTFPIPSDRPTYNQFPILNAAFDNARLSFHIKRRI